MLSPTSLASKYIANDPAVVLPSDVAVKRTISESSTVPDTPAIDRGSVNDSRIWLEPTTANASIVALLRPTSDPSKKRL